MERGARNNQNATSSSSELRASSFEEGRESRQIVNTPVGGAMAYTDSRGQVVVRYIERDTGHVQDWPIQEKAPSKVTDTTVPKVFGAWFGKEGNHLVFQSLSGKNNELRTAFAEIKKSVATTSLAANTQLLGEPNLSTTIGNLDGTLLPGTVHAVAVAPDGTNYLYLNESKTGALGVIAPADKNKLTKSITTVFSSKLTEWTPAWPTSNVVTFTTRPAANLPGFMYRVNIGTRQKDLILKNIPGLMTNMSPDGTRVLYTENSGTGFTTHLYEVSKDAYTIFPLRTLVEKCIWSKKTATEVYCAVPQYVPPGRYPDDWYIGTVGFNDALWHIDLKTGETKRLFAPTSDQDRTMDMTKLFFDTKEQNLFWVNKSDATLWTISLGV